MVLLTKPNRMDMDHNAVAQVQSDCANYNIVPIASRELSWTIECNSRDMEQHNERWVGRHGLEEPFRGIWLCRHGNLFPCKSVSTCALSSPQAANTDPKEIEMQFVKW